jgi:hypothetical protein
VTPDVQSLNYDGTQVLTAGTPPTVGNAVSWLEIGNGSEYIGPEYLKLCHEADASLPDDGDVLTFDAAHNVFAPSPASGGGAAGTPSSLATTQNTAFGDSVGDSLGFGAQITAGAQVLLTGGVLLYNVSGNAECLVFVYRTTGTVPTFGSIVPEVDSVVRKLDIQFFAGKQYAPISCVDTTPTSGDTYTYYIALYTGGTTYVYGNDLDPNATNLTAINLSVAPT